MCPVTYKMMLPRKYDAARKEPYPLLIVVPADAVGPPRDFSTSAVLPAVLPAVWSRLLANCVPAVLPAVCSLLT